MNSNVLLGKGTVPMYSCSGRIVWNAERAWSTKISGTMFELSVSKLDMCMSTASRISTDFSM